VIELLRSQGYRRFATVTRRPRVAGGALGRWLLTPLARLLVGESVEVAIRERFEPGFYFFIVALPDWVPG
jgi:hypothetical protein